MAKKFPKAGRPAKTAGKSQPPRTPGATEGGGRMRERAGEDEPYNPLGKVNGPDGGYGKPPPAGSRKP